MLLCSSNVNSVFLLLKNSYISIHVVLIHKDKQEIPKTVTFRQAHKKHIYKFTRKSEITGWRVNKIDCNLISNLNTSFVLSPYLGILWERNIQSMRVGGAKVLSNVSLSINSLLRSSYTTCIHNVYLIIRFLFSQSKTLKIMRKIN